MTGFFLVSPQSGKNLGNQTEEKIYLVEICTYLYVINLYFLPAYGDEK